MYVGTYRVLPSPKTSNWVMIDLDRNENRRRATLCVCSDYSSDNEPSGAIPAVVAVYRCLCRYRISTAG